MLKGKKILLAVCGSISFYKSYEIISKFKKLEAEVYVTLSDGVLKFVNEISFEALSNHKVLSSKTYDWAQKIDHISYSQMDLVIIAPASVNTINKLACGICDNEFMATLIAANKIPTIIAPAANQNMLEHFATINSLEILKNLGYYIIEPVEKILACGINGKGGLCDIQEIVWLGSRILLQDEFYKNKTVVVTGGPTTEKIDDVRAITNFSSGKMAKSLCDAFYYLGADVKFISSVDFSTPYKIIKFESTTGLKSAIANLKMNNDDILMMCAAVSDYLPSRKSKGKLKKTDLGKEWNLPLVENVDILMSLKNSKFTKIGFKLEVDKEHAKQNAKDTLINKNLDAICLNIIDDKIKFGSNETMIDFITKKGEILIQKANKLEVAFKIANLIKEL